MWISYGGDDDWQDTFISNVGYDHVPPEICGTHGSCKICGDLVIQTRIDGRWQMFHDVGPR